MLIGTDPKFSLIFITTAYTEHIIEKKKLNISFTFHSLIWLLVAFVFIWFASISMNYKKMMHCIVCCFICTNANETDSSIYLIFTFHQQKYHEHIWKICIFRKNQVVIDVLMKNKQKLFEWEKNITAIGNVRKTSIYILQNEKIIKIYSFCLVRLHGIY